ncbi:MAG: ABC transporter ATP-binding protein [Bacteroidetes bacterium]|nr:MAG: ABC transporter ATP-binding protein [Bacteroidota bacterium]
MNHIILENIAKRYAREWIFRGLSIEFLSNRAYVILGSNGSGKSTLLQIVSSFLTPTKGTIKYFADQQEVPIEKVYQYMSIATPYLELPEEFTLMEVLAFHRKLKPFYSDYSNQKMVDIMELNHAKDKKISNFSSGMKQRVKLGLAILSKTDLLLIDEPSSNLDANAIEWFQKLIKAYKKDRIIVICSNHIKVEYAFCEHEIVMEDFKKKT